MDLRHIFFFFSNLKLGRPQGKKKKAKICYMIKVSRNVLFLEKKLFICWAETNSMSLWSWEAWVWTQGQGPHLWPLLPGSNQVAQACPPPPTAGTLSSPQPPGLFLLCPWRRPRGPHPSHKAGVKDKTCEALHSFTCEEIFATNHTKSSVIVSSHPVVSLVISYSPPQSALHV